MYAVDSHSEVIYISINRENTFIHAFISNIDTVLLKRGAQWSSAVFPKLWMATHFWIVKLCQVGRRSFLGSHLLVNSRNSCYKQRSSNIYLPIFKQCP